MLFIDSVHEYLPIRQPQVNALTFLGTQNVLLNHCNTLHSVEISDIDYRMLQLLLNSKIDLSKRTVKHIKQELILFYKYLLKQDYIHKNIAELLDIPKNLSIQTTDSLSLDEIRWINSFKHKYALFPNLLLFTGMRRGEALALQKDDIDFKNQIARVYKSIEFSTNSGYIKSTKTAAGTRLVPLSDNICIMLLEIIPRLKDNQFVFHKPRNIDQHHSLTSFRRMWDNWYIAFKEYCNENNYSISHITTRRFRTTYATLLVEKQTPDLIIEKCLGHTDAAFTKDVYVNLHNDFIQSEFSKVRNVFSDILPNNM